MPEMSDKEAIIFGCSGMGCMVAAGASLVLPGIIGKPVIEISTDAVVDINPAHIIKDDAKAKLASINHQLESLSTWEKWDGGRAILMTAVVLLLEIPEAIPQVLHHMAEFSKTVPNWVPEAAAGAAVAYGLSYLVMRKQRLTLEEVNNSNDSPKRTYAK